MQTLYEEPYFYTFLQDEETDEYFLEVKRIIHIFNGLRQEETIKL